MISKVKACTVSGVEKFFSLPSSLAPSPIVFFFVLGSAFARLNLLFYEPQKKKHSKTTAIYAGYYTAFFSVTFGKRPYSFSFVKCYFPKEIVTKIPKEVVTVPTC